MLLLNCDHLLGLILCWSVALKVFRVPIFSLCTAHPFPAEGNEQGKKKERHLPADKADGRRWGIPPFHICVNLRDLRAIPNSVAAGHR
jgi:hypothetical protein